MTGIKCTSYEIQSKLHEYCAAIPEPSQVHA